MTFNEKYMLLDHHTTRFIKTVDDMLEYTSIYGIDEKLLRRIKPISEKQAKVLMHYFDEERIDDLRRNMKYTSNKIGRVLNLQRKLKEDNQLSIQYYNAQNAYISDIIKKLEGFSELEFKIISTLILSECYRIEALTESDTKKRKHLYKNRRTCLKEVGLMAKSLHYETGYEFYLNDSYLILEIPFLKKLVFKYNFREKEYKWWGEYQKKFKMNDCNFKIKKLVEAAESLLLSSENETD